MTSPYDKPHRSYDEQLALLQGRGLACADDAKVLDRLRAVGYYRLSAYVYPFREMLPAAQQRQASPTHYRSEVIRPETTFDDVEALWKFDRRLRLLVLDAVEAVEVGLRTKIASVLGSRDAFGHLNVGSLNAKVCDQPYWRDGRNDDTEHEVWLGRYDQLIRDAGKEDFIRHNAHKYDELPVWIAVEALTFGSTVRLFGLLRQDDQTAIARELGVKGGVMLGAWLEAVNYARNVAAHHARLWNRSMTYKVRRFNEHQVGAELAHLAGHTPTEKIYSSLAVTAYLLRSIDPTTNWHLTLRTHVRKFPLETGMSPVDNMGFPDGWEELPLWKGGP